MPRAIEARNGPKNFGLNQATLNTLIDAYTDETQNWIGKEVKLWIIKAVVSGKFQLVAYLAPQGWEMDDEGHFTRPGSDQITPNAGIKYPEEEEINPDDIPF